MPGGIYDSSKTRVAPVFDALRVTGVDWVRKLVSLAQGNPHAQKPNGVDMQFLHGAWGKTEASIPPPVSLLSWMIRHPDRLRANETEDSDRRLLLDGNAIATAKALDLLRSEAATRAWYIFEGSTVPDAYIETPDALVVVEGKRTEAGPTIDTTWLKGRHQIWRHIDAAWERRGNRKVFGLFIVEGTRESGEVPELWLKSVRDALSPAIIESSLPHRGPEEREGIASSLLGVTTWQRVVQTFNLPPTTLVDRIARA